MISLLSIELGSGSRKKEEKKEDEDAKKLSEKEKLRLAMMEVLTAIKRAGADMMLTYFARDVAELLRDG